MAGHSKWEQIRRQKAVTDHRRGNAFTKLARAITVAVKEGGGIGDPAMNFKLRLAVEKARQANMPKSNIERAIDQGLGKGDSAQMETIVYEGYGPAGIAVMVESVTDNRQRSYHEIRQIFEKGGGTMGQPGSVGFMFEHVGKVVGRGGESGEEKILGVMDLPGVVDVTEEAGEIIVVTDSKELAAVTNGIEGLGMEIVSSELVMKPHDLMPVEGDKEEAVLGFLEKLEDNDDVQRVFTNADV